MPTLSAAIAAAGSALTAERVRLEAAVSNLANAETTKGPDGKPYRRRDVVLQTADVSSFDATLLRANSAAVGVRVAAVVEDQGPFPRRYDPSDQNADADGYVELPNVNPADETVDMISAARAYQANLSAIGMIRDLVQRALDLGR
jgi:flagellar basal-body rod protein FlgC